MKKALLILTVMLGTTFSAWAQLEITVKDLKDPEGSVMIGLFNNEKDFLNKASEGKIVPLQADSVTIVFENLSPGDYAISVIHDRNNNGKLDKNSFGFPKEGFAFGNNAMGIFGPPSFEKAKVTLNKKRVKQVLRLKYF